MTEAKRYNRLYMIQNNMAYSVTVSSDIGNLNNIDINMVKIKLPVQLRTTILYLGVTIRKSC